MSLSIEIVNSPDLRTSFVDFYDTVYEYRDARWPGKKAEEHLLLSGESPLIAGKPFRALLAIDGDRVVARGIALEDSNYLRYWNDHVGHLILFEALDESDVAVRRLVDEACAYLSQHGIESVRAGYGLLDTPFPIDDYESLPPMSVRQSPMYYHRLLKNAGFQTEKGWVDYRLRITDESLELGRMLRDRLLPVSYELIQFADLAETKLVSDLTEIRNECFKSHWGTTPAPEVRPIGRITTTPQLRYFWSFSSKVSTCQNC